MKRLAGPAWLPSFFILYLAIAAAVIAIWRWQPVVSLALFLLVSALHFGLDALRERHDPIPRLGQLARITVRGVLPIALPSFLASAEVTEVYRLLLPADMLLKATLVERIASIALLSTAGLTVLAVVSEGTSTAIALAKSAVPLVLLYLFLPPLLAFAVFFCFDHSMRHVLELSHRFDPQRALRGARDFIWAALPLSLVTVLGGAAAFYYTRGAGDIDLALARTTFIGLAALTVPHMLVTEIAETATQEATAGRPPGRGGVQR
jgi:Brp/Blh family beta-carotene 15,15'-monooxygenase